MNRYAYKRADGSVGIMNIKAGASPEDFLPDGAVMMNQIDETLNPLPDVQTKSSWVDDGLGNVIVDVSKVREQKMSEIRAKRDEMLVKSDTMWIECTTKGASSDVTDIEADKVVLRDMAASAQTALDALSDVEDIMNHDAFASLTLNKAYE